MLLKIKPLQLWLVLVYKNPKKKHTQNLIEGGKQGFLCYKDKLQYNNTVKQGGDLRTGFS